MVGIEPQAAQFRQSAAQLRIEEEGQILLACQRTILQIGKAQFSYTEAILNSWYKSGVKTLKDVERLDKEHEEAAKSLAARPSYTRKGKAKPSGKFDNFTSSGSDWDEVTRRIMETQEEHSGRRSQES
jgi:DnaD/phage-associated family protein